MSTEQDIARSNWILEAARAYEKGLGLLPGLGIDLAYILLDETLDGDITENPTQAAEEDLTYWVD